MTQYLKVDLATREVLGAYGQPDAADFVGPIDEPPAVEAGTVLVLWQVEALRAVIRPGGPWHRMVWPEGADAVEWIESGTLEQCRALAWERVKVAREAAEAASFEFEGGMYDPNKANVSGAALAALIAQLQGIEVVRNWTLADNSVRPLTGAQLIALGLALSARVDAVHERSRVLRGRISAAGTPAEAYSHTWESLDNE